MLQSSSQIAYTEESTRFHVISLDSMTIWRSLSVSVLPQQEEHDPSFFPDLCGGNHPTMLRNKNREPRLQLHGFSASSASLFPSRNEVNVTRSRSTETYTKRTSVLSEEDNAYLVRWSQLGKQSEDLWVQDGSIIPSQG